MSSSQTYETKGKTINGVRRMLICMLSIIIEVAIIVFVMNYMLSIAPYLEILIRVLAFVLVINIYNQNVTSAFKMPWLMLILISPIVGATMYFMMGFNNGTREMRTRYKKIDTILFEYLDDHSAITEKLLEENPKAGSISRYITNTSKYPVYNNTDITYYDDAAKGLEAQLAEMRKAENFIFMEYHAIENSTAWKRIEEVLVDRVKAGVEVRVFYDDMGSIGFVNTDFSKYLNSLGIQCRVFNPFRLGLNMFLNNRDHRKITVIDGKVGFTGGYNLANEYFNLTHPYGKWKDSGIRLEGDAVKSLTITFIEMWNAIKYQDNTNPKFDDYIAPHGYTGKEQGAYVQPYAFGPMDKQRIGEDVYISMVEKAEKYCWFITPYLIITDEMTHALTLAAKRGVDVRIITPGIPDKKIVYSITRSFYSDLADSGVRIYEWAPGFCHAKMSVVDDVMATCGTINLDYRSLYHHFENGCFLVGNQAVLDIRDDFKKTFGESIEVTKIYRNDITMRAGLKTAFLRIFAQLM